METKIFDPGERVFMGILIMVLVITGIIYWKRARNNHNFNEKRLLIGLSAFFIGYAFFEIFFGIGKYMIEGRYIGHSFYGNFEKTSIYYNIFAKLAQISVTIGNSIFLFESERIIKRTRYIISILNVIGLFLVIILPWDSTDFLYKNILLPAHVGLFLIIIFFFTKWARLEFKAVASVQVLAMGFIALGSLMHDPEFQVPNQFPLALSYVFIIIGALVSMSSGIINPKRYSRALNYWLALGGSAIAFFAVTVILSLISQYITMAIAIGLVNSIAVYIFIRTVQNIKKQSALLSQSAPSTVNQGDVLQGFIKRKDITEKEITYYKEQKICLVCKGNATGLNLAFICPDCDVLYCEKCVRVLIGMENACWVCNSPLDPSRPVNTDLEETGELDVDLDAVVEPEENIARDAIQKK
ncbi:MAG: hypothetical protein ACFFCS_16420 [Candidatus Hodarchaeota archaeon]